MFLKRFWPLLLLAALVLLLAFGLGREQKPLASALVGKPMPAFELPALKNQRVTYDESLFKGRVFVLNVWASWCEACTYEHKIFVESPLPEDAMLIGLNYKDQTGHPGISHGILSCKRPAPGILPLLPRRSGWFRRRRPSCL